VLHGSDRDLRRGLQVPQRADPEHGSAGCWDYRACTNDSNAGDYESSAAGTGAVNDALAITRHPCVSSSWLRSDVCDLQRSHGQRTSRNWRSALCRSSAYSRKAVKQKKIRSRVQSRTAVSTKLDTPKLENFYQFVCRPAFCATDNAHRAPASTNATDSIFAING
jgi:hypothetical protein